MIDVFGPADMTTLAGGTDITKPAPSQGIHAVIIQNATPYWMEFRDDRNQLVAVVAPWSYQTAIIRQPTMSLQVKSRSDMPKHDLNPATTSGEWHVYVTEFDKTVDLLYGVMVR